MRMSSARLFIYQAYSGGSGKKKKHTHTEMCSVALLQPWPLPLI